jgi:hypothetical protein
MENLLSPQMAIDSGSDKYLLFSRLWKLLFTKLWHKKVL